jgi:hypothetical protein
MDAPEITARTHHNIIITIETVPGGHVGMLQSDRGDEPEGLRDFVHGLETRPQEVRDEVARVELHPRQGRHDQSACGLHVPDAYL